MSAPIPNSELGFLVGILNHLRAVGIYTEGVFQKSATNKMQIEVMMQKVKTRRWRVANWGNFDVHNVANGFKQILRSMSDPLIPFAEKKPKPEFVQYLKERFGRVDHRNYVLNTLAQLAVEFDAKKVATKLDLRKVAHCLGPSTIRGDPREMDALMKKDPMQAMKKAGETSKQTNFILQTMFEHRDEIWGRHPSVKTLRSDGLSEEEGKQKDASVKSIALYDYNPSKPNQKSLKKNSLYLVSREANGWANCHELLNFVDCGWAPAKYLKKVEEKKQDHQSEADLLDFLDMSDGEDQPKPKPTAAVTRPVAKRASPAPVKKKEVVFFQKYAWDPDSQAYFDPVSYQFVDTSIVDTTKPKRAVDAIGYYDQAGTFVYYTEKELREYYGYSEPAAVVQQPAPVVHTPAPTIVQAPVSIPTVPAAGGFPPIPGGGAPVPGGGVGIPSAIPSAVPSAVPMSSNSGGGSSGGGRGGLLDAIRSGKKLKKAKKKKSSHHKSSSSGGKPKKAAPMSFQDQLALRLGGARGNASSSKKKSKSKSKHKHSHSSSHHRKSSSSSHRKSSSSGTSSTTSHSRKPSRTSQPVRKPPPSNTRAPPPSNTRAPPPSNNRAPPPSNTRAPAPRPSPSNLPPVPGASPLGASPVPGIPSAVPSAVPNAVPMSNAAGGGGGGRGGLLEAIRSGKKLKKAKKKHKSKSGSSKPAPKKGPMSIQEQLALKLGGGGAPKRKSSHSKKKSSSHRKSSSSSHRKSSAAKPSPKPSSPRGPPPKTGAPPRGPPSRAGPPKGPPSRAGPPKGPPSRTGPPPRKTSSVKASPRKGSVTKPKLAGRRKGSVVRPKIAKRPGPPRRGGPPGPPRGGPPPPGRRGPPPPRR